MTYDELICEECGNDLVCQGYAYCSDCLELLVGEWTGLRRLRHGQ